jgi:hypothetical protein
MNFPVFSQLAGNWGVPETGGPGAARVALVQQIEGAVAGSLIVIPRAGPAQPPVMAGLERGVGSRRP